MKILENKNAVQNTRDVFPGSGKQWICREIEFIYVGQVLEGNDIHFEGSSLYVNKFLPRFIFLLLEEPPLIF